MHIFWFCPQKGIACVAMKWFSSVVVIAITTLVTARPEKLNKDHPAAFKEALLAHSRAKRDLFVYGNWCGVGITGVGTACTCEDTVADCEAALAPKDSLDAACLEHDLCLCNKPPGDLPELIALCQCNMEIYNDASANNVCTEYSWWWNFFARSSCESYRAGLKSAFLFAPCYCQTSSSVVLGFPQCQSP
ncbi:uncharacterized protein LOC106181296 isoform X1 [Lingula anatina]|uniref:Uncharacterized protein LOC106181296 isoform X1 n=2 Tax=Lingula anatina TaxID=7574 RepID=A0A1S3KEM4_LINAN|nr:uncharacterized protein LOC106181296 isoform X1 [Lingula anatina]|eukprot:XP_013421080.2 uncharacterized protein LOC106181296 isoform X1 [Lingula anatina]